MRTSHFAAFLVANTLGVAALDTIAGYAKDIPSCAFSAFKKALKSENCDVSDVDSGTIDCLCRHSGAIAVVVAKAVDTQCSADFAQAIGSVCGIYDVYGSTASEIAQATSIIADDLDSGSGGSNTASESSGAQSTAGSGSATAATATSTKSDNGAALPTGVSGLVGLVGGAAAVAGMLI